MKSIVILVLSCLSLSAFGQGCPPNIDFEYGNFSNWQCSVGSTSSDSVNHIMLDTSRPTPGQHEIISAQTIDKLDYYGNFPKLCPYGGGYSVKLGNEQAGYGAEGLSYTFTIPNLVDTFTFTYFYAVVFEDPKHAAHEQPRFFVTAYDVLTGALIDCASYNYVATSDLPGFLPSPKAPGVLYKNWSPVSIQFAGLANRQVRLEFKTADCTQGGHFGYAYVDVGTGCSNILATAPYCIGTNSLIMNAPYGFETYTWFNEDYSKVIGSGQTITFSPPPVTSGTFHVDMIPYPGFGCRDTASATVMPERTPDTPGGPSLLYYCQNALAEPLTASADSGYNLLWYTSDTAVGDINAPVPPVGQAGTLTYYVTQKRFFGCEGPRKKITVIVHPTPVSAFYLNQPRQCEESNEFILTSDPMNPSASMFIWDFGDGEIDSAHHTAVTHRYKTIGNFNAKLKIINPGGCTSESMYNLAVVPRPVASFRYPQLICEGQALVDLYDESQVPSGLSYVAQWNWTIDGIEQQARNPAPFYNSGKDSIRVSLWVSSMEGCVSDTASVSIPVRARPEAAFGYTSVLCENEWAAFRDSSRISGTADEQVSAWHWNFGDGGLAGDQHPAHDYSAGIYWATLIAESNFGCRSEPYSQQLTIHPTPRFTLAVSDSCVNRSIEYQATDLQRDIVEWQWNFGKGFHTGEPMVMQAFGQAGDESFALMAVNDRGCRDTIFRTFAIYENNAFAGRDTLVARGEPLYLNAGGPPGAGYLWTPSTGLSDPYIEKPVALLDRDQEYTLESVSRQGCESRSKIFVERYAGPDIYIPNAFSPNHDGKNDYLRILPVGIRSFLSLTVFNRYGQRVYHSSDYSKGWDGTVNGYQQDAGTYVVSVRAIDYKGGIMEKRGTVILVR